MAAEARREERKKLRETDEQLKECFPNLVKQLGENVDNFNINLTGEEDEQEKASVTDSSFFKESEIDGGGKEVTKGSKTAETAILESSDESNEFWDIDPELAARTLLSKGRKIYKKTEIGMYENKNDKHNKQVSFKNEQECQKAGGAKADDYDIFIDIKKSYETALGKYVHQVGQLKAELREERLKRIRFETMANEIKGREKKVLDEINLKHNSELKLLIDKERASIYKQFK